MDQIDRIGAQLRGQILRDRADSRDTRVTVPLSADEIDALRFCVETANHCVRNHPPIAYTSAMGKLARAYDILARAAMQEGE